MHGAADARPGRTSRERATIRTVAEHAGVSRQTVSNALNSPARLSASTLARVRRSITALGYRPDHAARALSSRRSQLIGVRVGPTQHSSAGPDALLRALVAAALPHGYRFLVFDAPAGDDAAEIAAYAELLAGGDVDALVVTDTRPGDTRPAWLTEQGVPFAVFGSPWPVTAGADDAASTAAGATEAHAWVDVDAAAGTAAAVDHLVANGHTRIAFLGWPSDGAGGDARRDGWRGALLRHGLDTGLEAHAEADDVTAGARRAAPLLAASAPTAVVCASDLLALGTAAALADAGAAPGRDVAVTGFDDSDLARLARPALTSVRQPFTLVARTLVEQVLTQLGTDLGRPSLPGGLIAPSLVVRESSSPRPHIPAPSAAPSDRPTPRSSSPVVTPSATPWSPSAALRDIDAVLFDLDGVLTPTALVHMHAWARLFEPFLAARGARPYVEADYYAHIDGKPRYDGVRSLLASRGIELPDGDPTDAPEADTVCGLGNRKNAVFTSVLESEGVAPYPGSVLLVDALIAAGVQVAVVSSSRNARPVLAAAGLADRFPLVVDGLVAAAQGLAGKPDPATYAYAAEQLGVARGRAAVVEDAESGVASGRAGAFGLVVGVDRGAGAAVLLEQGADLVVDDLAELLEPAEPLEPTGGAR